jgi:hypothetical protein
MENTLQQTEGNKSDDFQWVNVVRPCHGIVFSTKINEEQIAATTWMDQERRRLSDHLQN